MVSLWVQVHLSQCVFNLIHLSAIYLILVFFTSNYYPIVYMCHIFLLFVHQSDICFLALLAIVKMTVIYMAKQSSYAVEGQVLRAQAKEWQSWVNVVDVF